jgi:hypothetical protein
MPPGPPTPQQLLASWVRYILEEDLKPPAKIRPKTGTVDLTDVHRKYFASCKDLKLPVLRKLHQGKFVRAKAVRAFVAGLPILAAVRTELYIRWGEAMLGCQAYVATPQQREEFEAEFLRNKVKLLGQLKPRDHRVSTPKDFKKGFRIYLKSHKMPIKDVKGRTRKTVQQFLKSAKIGPDGFVLLLDQLRPKKPASGEGLLQFEQQCLTHAKLMAYYIQHQLNINILELEFDDLYAGFNLGQIRLIDWLIATSIPIIKDGIELGGLFLE